MHLKLLLDGTEVVTISEAEVVLGLPPGHFRPWMIPDHVAVIDGERYYPLAVFSPALAGRDGA